MTTVALSVLLAFVTANLVRRGLAVHHKETLELQRMLNELEQDGSTHKLLDGTGSSSGSLAAAAEGDQNLLQRREQQQQQLNLEAAEDQLREPLLGAAEGGSNSGGPAAPADAALAPPPVLVVPRRRRLPDVPLGKLAILIGLLVGGWLCSRKTSAPPDAFCFQRFRFLGADSSSSSSSKSSLCMLHRCLPWQGAPAAICRPVSSVP